MITLKKIIIILGISILIIIPFAFCKFSEIIDLIHKDTEDFKVEKGSQLISQEIEKYQINGVVLIPYTRQNPFETYEDKYYKYSLRLAAYKQSGNQEVVVNKVSISGINNVKFKKNNKNLNQQLEFKTDGSNEFQSSESVLINEINDYNMNLSSKSKIKVILNVSIKENGKETNRDLEYIFETRIRKYLV